MTLIPVEQAELGMVLSGPVTDRRGRLIMPAGRALEERHLEALPMWGITHIEVEGDGSEAHDDPLNVVNSAFFSFPRRIDTVSQAVTGWGPPR